MGKINKRRILFNVVCVDHIFLFWYFVIGLHEEYHEVICGYFDGELIRK